MQGGFVVVQSGSQSVLVRCRAWMGISKLVKRARKKGLRIPKRWRLGIRGAGGILPATWREVFPGEVILLVSCKKSKEGKKKKGGGK